MRDTYLLSSDFTTRSLKDALRNWELMRSSWLQVLSAARRSADEARTQRAQEGVSHADLQLEAIRTRLLHHQGTRGRQPYASPSARTRLIPT